MHLLPLSPSSSRPPSLSSSSPPAAEFLEVESFTDSPDWNPAAATRAFVAQAGAEAAVNAAAEQAKLADSGTKTVTGHATEHAAISNFAANAASRAFESAKDFANVASLASAAALRAAAARRRDRSELATIAGASTVTLSVTPTATSAAVNKSSKKANKAVKAAKKQLAKLAAKAAANPNNKELQDKVKEAKVSIAATLGTSSVVFRGSSLTCSSCFFAVPVGCSSCEEAGSCRSRGRR